MKKLYTICREILDRNNPNFGIWKIVSKETQTLPELFVRMKNLQRPTIDEVLWAIDETNMVVAGFIKWGILEECELLVVHKRIYETGEES